MEIISLILKGYGIRQIKDTVLKNTGILLKNIVLFKQTYIK